MGARKRNGTGRTFRSFKQCGRAATAAAIIESEKYAGIRAYFEAVEHVVEKFKKSTFFAARVCGQSQRIITVAKGTIMGFWDQLKSNAATMNASLQTNVSKFKNADFANGTMAMCALIASADGSIDASERSKTAALITSNETLKIFEASELKQKFDFFCDKLTADFDFGRIEAIQAVSKLKSKPDQARAVIQVGIIIGGADGNFDKDEMKAVRDACLAVGIPPTDFDL